MMMSAAEQFAEFGASAEASGRMVVLQVGKELVALQPHEAQHFSYYLARAVYQAGGTRRTPQGHTVLARKRPQ